MTFRNISIYTISLLFVVGGTMHFTHDTELAAITPLPFAYAIVWVTGIMEFFFALFLLLPKYRQATALWLSLFCLLVLPANINMAINDLPMFGQQVDVFTRWIRIVLQFPLIAWILYAANVFSVLKALGLGAFISCTQQQASGN
jgi:uncharacterized membrane protein